MKIISVWVMMIGIAIILELTNSDDTFFMNRKTIDKGLLSSNLFYRLQAIRMNNNNIVLRIITDPRISTVLPWSITTGSSSPISQSTTNFTATIEPPSSYCGISWPYFQLAFNPGLGDDLGNSYNIAFTNCIGLYIDDSGVLNCVRKDGYGPVDINYVRIKHFTYSSCTLVPVTLNISPMPIDSSKIIMVKSSSQICSQGVTYGVPEYYYNRNTELLKIIRSETITKTTTISVQSSESDEQSHTTGWDVSVNLGLFNKVLNVGGGYKNQWNSTTTNENIFSTVTTSTNTQTIEINMEIPPNSKRGLEVDLSDNSCNTSYVVDIKSCLNDDVTCNVKQDIKLSVISHEMKENVIYK